MPYTVAEHIQRLEGFRQGRSNWDSQWEEAARRLVPAHVQTFHTRGRNWTKGQKRTEEMYDATAALNLSRFQSVMESLATPASSQWHRLAPGEPELRKDRDVMAYLELLVKRLFEYRYRPKANFVGQNQKTLNSYGAYGNGLLWVDGDPVEGGLRYRNLHLGQVYIDENHQGVVDTMYRQYQLKPRQIIQEFGKTGDIPESVFKLAESTNTAQSEYDILHAVFPRSDYDRKGIGPESMPYESVYIFLQEQHVLRRGGYRSFPLSMARYMQYSGEMYGRGPAQLVLASIKLLNEQKKTVIKQGHRQTDPVLLAYDDGLVGTFSLKAGAINAGGVSADGKALIHTLPTGSLAIGEKMMDMEKKAIDDAFLVSLFLILTENPQMTATEALERTREKGMLIAPTAGRLQAEYLGPTIEREIDVLAMQGLLPPPPPQLVEAGGVYTVDYDSPMSRMMRAENASGFGRSLETASNVAKMTGDTSVMDHFNFDVAIPEMNEINGMPVTWTRTDEEVEEIRLERRKQMEQQQMIENAAGLAQAAGAVGNLTQTTTVNNNA